MTEEKYRDKIATAIHTKCMIESYAELYKCGAITRPEFIGRTKLYLSYTPAPDDEMVDLRIGYDE